MTLTSLQNPLLKQIRLAVGKGRALEDGRVVAEGPHLLREAMRSAWRVDQVLFRADAEDQLPELLDGVMRSGVPVQLVGEAAFDKMSDTAQSQGVLALLKSKQWEWREIWSDPRPVVILDGIQDPGNVGSIVRSAEAFGAAGVILLTGCAKSTNGKVLRASAGSFFRMPFRESVGVAELLEEAKPVGLRLLALAADGTESVTGVRLIGRFGLIAGSEGAGVRDELRRAADATVSIPTQTVESLNVAIACSVVLYEAARQRNEARPGV